MTTTSLAPTAAEPLLSGIVPRHQQPGQGSDLPGRGSATTRSGDRRFSGCGLGRAVLGGLLAFAFTGLFTVEAGATETVMAEAGATETELTGGTGDTVDTATVVSQPALDTSETAEALVPAVDAEAPAPAPAPTPPDPLAPVPAAAPPPPADAPVKAASPVKPSRQQRQRSSASDAPSNAAAERDSGDSSNTAPDSSNRAAEGGDAPAESPADGADPAAAADEAPVAGEGDAQSAVAADDGSTAAAADSPADTTDTPPAGTAVDPGVPAAVIPAPEARPPTGGAPHVPAAPAQAAGARPVLSDVLSPVRSAGVLPSASPPALTGVAALRPPAAPAAPTLFSHSLYAGGGAAPATRSTSGGDRSGKPERSHRTAVVHAPDPPSAPPSGNLHAASAAAPGGGSGQDMWCALVLFLALVAAHELRRHRVRLGISVPAGFTVASERPG
jgi:hypothetical protein